MTDWQKKEDALLDALAKAYQERDLAIELADARGEERDSAVRELNLHKRLHEAAGV